jgi:DNA protecting protein DprA
MLEVKSSRRRTHRLWYCFNNAIAVYSLSQMNLLYDIALTKVAGIGPMMGRQLLNHFGSAEAIFTAAKKDLAAVSGLRARLIDKILTSDALREAERELRFAEKHTIQILHWRHQEYPKRLADCPDAPLILYYKGNTDLNTQRIVSIVGTRSATPYGKSICADFLQDLAPYGVLVISGLAYGIDSLAHRHSLTHRIPTVGVLGHGLDRIYPPSNREMAAQMVENGGLITEFPSGTPPLPSNFPMRNRIIAGLADVTIVVEAARKGGALITAEIANTYNRDVCAFPGNVKQAFSAGCNYLIKTNRAHLITTVKDLEYLMGWTPETATSGTESHKPPQELTDEEQQIYTIIRNAVQISLDDLALKLQWPQGKLAVTLLEMEMKGAIAALPGKIYRII